MNFISIPDSNRLNELVSRLSSNAASAAEMKEFLDLVEKSGMGFHLMNYLHSAGYYSIDDFKQAIQTKQSQEFVQGLATIGLGILIAYGLDKLLNKK
jgi:hypothetical protein